MNPSFLQTRRFSLPLLQLLLLWLLAILHQRAAIIRVVVFLILLLLLDDLPPEAGPRLDLHFRGLRLVRIIYDRLELLSTQHHFLLLIHI